MFYIIQSIVFKVEFNIIGKLQISTGEVLEANFNRQVSADIKNNFDSPEGPKACSIKLVLIL